jgi:capsular polysaccharide biosynthesis protein
MEFARTLRTLWNRRRLVVFGLVVATMVTILAVYSVSLFPPSLHSRTKVFATASTQILVDTPESAFADLSSNIEPLETRASVFARFLASPVAVTRIAKKAGMPPDSIDAKGPFEINVPLFEVEPTAEQRSSQIVGERDLYRLRFEANPNLPIISVFAQAPTEKQARTLAGAVPVALRDYIEEIQDHQDTPARSRVEIRRLGEATGGVVNKGADLQIAVLVFIAVMIGWCMLLIPAQTIAKGWREAGKEETEAGQGRGRNGNGFDQGVAGPERVPHFEQAP